MEEERDVGDPCAGCRTGDTPRMEDERDGIGVAFAVGVGVTVPMEDLDAPIGDVARGCRMGEKLRSMGTEDEAVDCGLPVSGECVGIGVGGTVDCGLLHAWLPHAVTGAALPDDVGTPPGDRDGDDAAREGDTGRLGL